MNSDGPENDKKNLWKDGIPHVYQYRRKCDDFLDIVFIGFLVLGILGAIIFFATREGKPKPPPRPPVEVKMPDAENVGNQVGSSAAGFGKGFYDGFNNRLHGKKEEKKEEVKQSK